MLWIIDRKKSNEENFVDEGEVAKDVVALEKEVVKDVTILEKEVEKVVKRKSKK